MLTSFTLENFKSFREPATLPLAPLTMLAGANASGKSNLVEALRLLSWIAQGHRLSTINHVLQASGNPIRGTLKDLGFSHSNIFSFSCKTNHPDWDRYSIKLTYDEDHDELEIGDGYLTGKKQKSYLFRVIDQYHDGTLEVEYNNFKPGPAPRIFINAQMSILLQMQSLKLFDRRPGKGQKKIPEVAAYYRNCLSETTFLDPKPYLMRGYSFKTDRQLDDDGKNLSAILYNQCQDKINQRNILEFVKILPEQDICGIGFIETPRSEVMVKLTEAFGGNEKEVDASLLSDGTLRVLAIAASVFSAKEGSLVVIEEIDNGIHPSRAEILLQQLVDIAKGRKLRLLLTTHNPALLDALPEEAVPDIVFCFREPKTGVSQLTRLSDLTDYTGLVARGGIGTLMTQGVVDRFVKNPRTPDEKRRQALAWLEEVRAETG